MGTLIIVQVRLMISKYTNNSDYAYVLHNTRPTLSLKLVTLYMYPMLPGNPCCVVVLQLLSALWFSCYHSPILSPIYWCYISSQVYSGAQHRDWPVIFMNIKTYTLKKEIIVMRRIQYSCTDIEFRNGKVSYTLHRVHFDLKNLYFN